MPRGGRATARRIRWSLKTRSVSSLDCKYSGVQNQRSPGARATSSWRKRKSAQTLLPRCRISPRELVASRPLLGPPFLGEDCSSEESKLSGGGKWLVRPSPAERSRPRGGRDGCGSRRASASRGRRSRGQEPAIATPYRRSRGAPRPGRRNGSGNRPDGGGDRMHQPGQLGVADIVLKSSRARRSAMPPDRGAALGPRCSVPKAPRRLRSPGRDARRWNSITSANSFSSISFQVHPSPRRSGFWQRPPRARRADRPGGRGVQGGSGVEHLRRRLAACPRIAMKGGRVVQEFLPKRRSAAADSPARRPGWSRSPVQFSRVRPIPWR